MIVDPADFVRINLECHLVPSQDKRLKSMDATVCYTNVQLTRIRVRVQCQAVYQLVMIKAAVLDSAMVSISQEIVCPIKSSCAEKIFWIRRT